MIYTYNKLRWVVEELFSNLESLRTKIHVVPCWEFILADWPLGCQSVHISTPTVSINNISTYWSFQPWSRTPAMVCIHSSTSRAWAQLRQLSVVPAILSCRRAYFGGAPGSTGWRQEQKLELSWSKGFSVSPTYLQLIGKERGLFLVYVEYPRQEGGEHEHGRV